jgi:hypothetical protein
MCELWDLGLQTCFLHAATTTAPQHYCLPELHALFRTILPIFHDFFDVRSTKWRCRPNSRSKIPRTRLCLLPLQQHPTAQYAHKKLMRCFAIVFSSSTYQNEAHTVVRCCVVKIRIKKISFTLRGSNSRHFPRLLSSQPFWVASAQKREEQLLEFLGIHLETHTN